MQDPEDRVHRLAMRFNVVELLAVFAASTIIALLVFVSGLAIGEAAAGPWVARVSAVVSTDVRLATSEHEGIQPTTYPCCALLYADGNMGQ